MVKNQELRIRCEINVRIWCILGAGCGEVFYPLARLVSDVAGQEVVFAVGGYEGKKIFSSQFGNTALKDLLRVPRDEGMTV